MEQMLVEVNKKCAPFRLFFVVFFYFCLSSSFAINSSEIDRLALIEFKAKLIDNLGVMDSWNNTTHVCHWYGVTCGRRHGRVVGLNLHSSQLVGAISSSIVNMSFLKDLQLQNNSVNGELPPEIGRLRRLRHLVLTNNSIGGIIPSNISHCSSLISIKLQNNDFVGEIPTSLGFLSNLQFLLISVNNFVGTIPPSLGNLTSLSQLLLGGNNLVGTIPDSFCKLRNLQTLAVPLNKLSGVFPPSILNLSQISILDLGVNRFYGRLPSKIGNVLPRVQFFSLGNNLFSGSIPLSVANMSSLRRLFLNSNKFIGEVPSFEKLEKLTQLSITNNSLGISRDNDLSFISTLINATNLSDLKINVNNFEGKLPETFSNLSRKLTAFHMDNNKISGHIPMGIENLVGLQDFRAWNNRLSGTIPENIGKLQSLQLLGLRDNIISGKIPFSFGNITRLLAVDLSYNNLHGEIPESLGNCQQLTSLDLQTNNLSGEIPVRIFEISSLSIVHSFCNNWLSGSLPKQVEKLKNLEILDVSENILSGEIPNSLGSCTSLKWLNMEGNFFQGSIPQSLSSLRGLQILDLSRNNLSGEIPEYLASFQLEQLNLSHNDFQGKVPKEGIFKNASVVDVVGNSGLCGGIPELKLSVCEFKKPKKKHQWRLPVVILFGFLGLILLSLLPCVVWFRKRKDKPTSSSQTLTTVSLLNVSYHSLFKATGRFSSENLIGIGSFGSVYKGTLDEGGIVVAVKVLNLQRQGAVKSFIAECEALRNIRHKNLVKVLTACSSIDNHGNDFKALVYEFMANGSFSDWLHPLADSNEGVPTRNLNFIQRLKIAMDVAFALYYLHHHCGATIIHCDLKPSNVLLDYEMIAHVGDFGLAKLLSISTPDTATTQSSSIGVRGTIGYACPEYGMSNEVSTQGDVYSFGILLLETYTGTRPTDDIFRAGLDLRRYCKEATPERLLEILDPSLVQELLAEERRETNLRRMNGSSNTRVLYALTSLFELAISCSAESPNDRPDISNAAAKLCAIKNQMLSN